MDKATELELDIQYIKGIINNCSDFYNNFVLKLKPDKNLFNTRYKFIFGQFKTVFYREIYYD